MAYTSTNFKTKKAFKEAVAAGKIVHGLISENLDKVSLYSPGFFGLDNSREQFVEGPHYPEPHRWYATAILDGDGYVVKVK